ncbi:unnamed protein product [Symbiodinium sp. CCMP2456]|nr:unnamed protein product [Symbiodinium sp. CCMP2456]
MAAGLRLAAARSVPAISTKGFSMMSAEVQSPSSWTPPAKVEMSLAPVKEIQVEPVVEITYEELKSLTPDVLDKLRKAFSGPRAYGAVAITGIPGYAEKRRRAFRAGIDLALLDPQGRERAAAVNNTYPGWSGTPGSETHPLQNSFLFNVKEELPEGKVDPFFGKNIFPSEEYRQTWVEFATSMYGVAVDVLRGCDKVMEQDVPSWSESPRSLAKMGDDGPALAGRFICYDSGFTREDRLLEVAKERNNLATGDVPDLSEPAKMSGRPGDYWLPWHVDSNFVTILHKEMYASEATGAFLSEPAGAGLMMMNEVGETTMFQCSDPDAMILQMGAFAQIYTGGAMSSCRHAVLNTLQPGVARFNYCNFWYVPWDTLCEPPPGMESTAVSKGWNAMMDESYLNITMRQSFSAFRQFMVSPEARIQFVNSERFKELSAILPLEKKPRARGVPDSKPDIQIDLLTDVRCPFSFISQTNLQAAVRNLEMQDHVNLRFHPIFLNPNVSKEGESLDDYLWREFGYTKEYAHSENYPLRQAGVKAGIALNPNRRVVNTFDAHCLIEVAQAQGKQEALEQMLSRLYFEEAKDISDVNVLAAAAAECGVDATLASAPETKAAVQKRYEDLSSMLGEVPHFLLREEISGNGMEMNGLKSVEEWEEVLKQVVERGQFVGVTIDGPHGKKVRLDEANPYSAVSHAMNAQHGWKPAGWPYEAEDFARMDESPDTMMYAEPRLVEHLDDASLERLSGAYDAFFKACPEGFAVLDLCSSWNSHYPEEALRAASRVAVHGLNSAELEANVQATERHVQDLNSNPVLPWSSDSFDIVTLALSVQYLTDPRAVFTEINRVLKPGGLAVVAFSHRAFIEKAVQVWAAEPDDGEGHAHLVSRYFQHGPCGGWEKLATVDVSPQHGDPVWLVTAVKPNSQ